MAGNGRLVPLRAIIALAVIGSIATACGGHTSQSAVRSPSPTSPIASNLPPGVCAPTYEELMNPDATRIEAKLVTFDILMRSDPDFPPGWMTPPRSAYFWVVALQGSFTVQPHSIAGNSTPQTFHLAIGYIQANSDASDPETIAHPCRGIGGSTTNGPWPAWFDQMAALDDVKIR
jgi:hypothetical protein